MEGSFNQGALGPVSMLLQSADPKCSEAAGMRNIVHDIYCNQRSLAVSYLSKFTDGAWHDKVGAVYLVTVVDKPFHAQ